jgi:hypothetical protein
MKIIRLPPSLLRLGVGLLHVTLTLCAEGGICDLYKNTVRHFGAAEKTIELEPTNHKNNISPN